MTPKNLVERLLEDSGWIGLGDGIEYQISGDEMTVFVPERKFAEVPEEFHQNRAEQVALDTLNSDVFKEDGSWSLQDSTAVSGTLHPNSDAVGWNVYFRDVSKLEPDYTD
jgi:hypothetical protein